MEAREEKIFADIDKLLIHDSSAISEFESDNFDDEILPARGLKESVHDFLFGEKKVTGLELPWFGLQDTIMFRPGELSVWNGINGHGKSLLLNQVMIGFIRQGSKVAVASFELQPEETLVRMICQSSGIKKPELLPKAVDEFFEKAEGQLYLYTETGDMKPKRVVALCRYVREVLNIDHLVIDSLMKCGTMEGDYAAEKKLVNSLQNVAKDTGLHIHLVTHSRKQKDEYESTGKFDVKGSGAIIDLADNVLIVKRNKKKELELRMANPDEKYTSQNDAYIVCEKQRHGNWEGIIGLYFHESGQYTRQQGRHMPLW